MTRRFNYNFLWLWILGLIGIPASLVPSQVMNYLTLIFSNGADNANTQAVVIVFLASILVTAMITAATMFLREMTMEELLRDKSLALFEQVLRADPHFFRDKEAAKISKRIIEETRRTESFLLDIKVEIPLLLVAVIMFGYVMFFGLDSTTPLVGEWLPEGFSQQGNWFLGVVILLLAPTQAGVLLFDRALQRVRKAMAIADDEVAQSALESIQSVRETRNYFAFDYAMERLRKSLEQLRKVEVSIAKFDALTGGYDPLINGLTKVLLLAAASYLCTAPIELPVIGVTVPQIGWNDYLGFAGIALVLDIYFNRVRNYLFRWRMAAVSFTRIKEYRNVERFFNDISPTDILFKKESGFVVKEVDLYLNETHILKRVSLKIPFGESIAIVGPSGSGKSTLLKLLMRELAPSEGKVMNADRPLAEISFESMTQHVVFVPQTPFIFQASIRENLLLGLYAETPEKIREVDCEIIEVLNSIGFALDAFRKGLERAFPENWYYSGIKEATHHIRANLQKQFPRVLNNRSFDSSEDLSLREHFLGLRLENIDQKELKRIDSAIKSQLDNLELMGEMILLGIESPAGEAGSNLSGGQASKVSLARALLKKPDYLLLDEATAALDKESEVKVTAAVAKAMQGHTVISVSHRLATIQNFDRIVVLDHGEIVQEGTFDELTSQPGLFQSLTKAGI